MSGTSVSCSVVLVMLLEGVGIKQIPRCHSHPTEFVCSKRRLCCKRASFWLLHVLAVEQIAELWASDINLL